MAVMAKRHSIARLATDPTTPEALRLRLATVEQIRRFSVLHLGLPDNGSYRSYADLERDFVVWNVFASPEFSLQPLRWCYALVGCLNYRGYFKRRDAVKFASKLRAQGHDVFVGGVAAYSTLGWFKDPVLNTMLRWDDARLAEVIFHELAHQKLYVRGDTPFNEAFATAVAKIGVERWLEKDMATTVRQRFKQDQRHERAFVDLVLATRSRLKDLYASALVDSEMRQLKRELFAACWVTTGV